ncbi:MAG: hypothetical protein SFZ03_04535 [Candidatus Melainabacteria bacterium]|nr:hypothetical protein [Candidatus Melainabacteria bacterium]
MVFTEQSNQFPLLSFLLGRRMMGGGPIQSRHDNNPNNLFLTGTPGWEPEQPDWLQTGGVNVLDWHPSFQDDQSGFPWASHSGVGSSWQSSGPMFNNSGFGQEFGPAGWQTPNTVNHIYNNTPQTLLAVLMGSLLQSQAGGAGQSNGTGQLSQGLKTVLLLSLLLNQGAGGSQGTGGLNNLPLPLLLMLLNQGQCNCPPEDGTTQPDAGIHPADGEPDGLVESGSARLLWHLANDYEGTMTALENGEDLPLDSEAPLAWEDLSAFLNDPAKRAQLEADLEDHPEWFTAAAPDFDLGDFDDMAEIAADDRAQDYIELLGDGEAGVVLQDLYNFGDRHQQDTAGGSVNGDYDSLSVDDFEFIDITEPGHTQFATGFDYANAITTGDITADEASFGLAGQELDMLSSQMGNFLTGVMGQYDTMTAEQRTIAANVAGYAGYFTNTVDNPDDLLDSVEVGRSTGLRAFMLGQDVSTATGELVNPHSAELTALGSDPNATAFRQEIETYLRTEWPPFATTGDTDFGWGHEGELIGQDYPANATNP